MKPRHLIPFAMLLAWQVAPVRVDTMPPSRSFGLSLGYGLAQFEDASFDCNGNFLSAERVELRSAGARADMLTSGGLRLTGFGGKTTSNRPDGNSTFAGFQLAWEGRRVGLGAGLTAGVPFEFNYSRRTQPNLYLRLGTMDGASFVTELLPPSENAGVIGLARTGVAFNQGQRGGVGAFVGLSLDPFSSVRGFADFTLPVTRSLDMLLRGEVGGGHQYTPYSLAVGARYRGASTR